MRSRIQTIQKALIMRVVSSTAIPKSYELNFEWTDANLQGKEVNNDVVQLNDELSFFKTSNLAEIHSTKSLLPNYNHLNPNSTPVMVYIPTTTSLGSNADELWAGWWYVIDVKSNYLQHSFNGATKSTIKYVQSSDILGGLLGDADDALLWYINNVGNPLTLHPSEQGITAIEQAVSNLQFLNNTSII